MGQRTVLVTGATNHPGKESIGHLLHRDYEVRALVRNPSSPEGHQLSRLGAELVEQKFSAEPAESRWLYDVLQGVETVFIADSGGETSTPPKEQVRQERAILNAITQHASVKTVFYLSSYYAAFSTSLLPWESKRATEIFLRESNIDHVILAPAFLMENILSEWTLKGIKSGCLKLPASANQIVPQVAADDLGALLVQLAERPDSYVGKRIEVIGDELSMEEMVHILADYLNSPIQYVSKPENTSGVNQEWWNEWEWLAKQGQSLPMTTYEESTKHFPQVNWHSFGAWLRSQDLLAMNKPAGLVPEPNLI
jgi:uncharacterized protein YbjT (DUF2867 family)